MNVERITIIRDGWGWHATLHACDGLATMDAGWRPTRRGAIRAGERAKRHVERRAAAIAATEQVWP